MHHSSEPKRPAPSFVFLAALRMLKANGEIHYRSMDWPACALSMVTGKSVGESLKTGYAFHMRLWEMVQDPNVANVMHHQACTFRLLDSNVKSEIRQSRFVPRAIAAKLSDTGHPRLGCQLPSVSTLDLRLSFTFYVRNSSRSRSHPKKH